MCLCILQVTGTHHIIPLITSPELLQQNQRACYGARVAHHTKAALTPAAESAPNCYPPQKVEPINTRAKPVPTLFRVMEQDWSWNRPAMDYIELYLAALKT
jgi:hypothetical protein